MGQDIQKGRRTEIDYLNGLVVVYAERLGSDSRMAGIFWDLSYCKFFSHSTIKPPLCMIEGSGYHFLRALLRGDRGWQSRRRRSART